MDGHAGVLVSVSQLHGVKNCLHAEKQDSKVLATSWATKVSFIYGAN